MGIPRKLKNLMLFNDGGSYVGEVKSVTLPVLTRKTEEWRGGGMNGPIEVDLGQEAMSMEWTCGGVMRSALSQWGRDTIDGVQLRFAGAYQKDDTGGVDSVEVVVRGRHKEIDMGDAEPGEDTEFKVTSAVSYYKLTWNGAVLIEIDLVNMIEMVNGVDNLAGIRAAIGI